MAPPTRSVPRPWRALAALAVLILIMLISITGSNTFNPGHWHKDFAVKLGLDLSSGTQVTLKAQTPNGTDPTSGEMTQAINIMESRVNATGNSGAQVQQQGKNIINVSVPGATSQQVVALVSTTAQLRFRQVLLYQPYGITPTPTPTPTTTPSPSASGTTSPAAHPSATATATTKAKIVRNAASPSASASPKASASASPAASASASPTPAATSPAATTYFGDKTKVSSAVFNDFQRLQCKPGPNANTVDDNWKKSVQYTDSNQWDNPSAQIVSCDSGGNKFVLDKAVVLGNQVTSATAGLGSTADWIVQVQLNSKASGAFGTLTTNQFKNYEPNCPSTGALNNDCALNMIGIVLDGSVISAPQTQGALVSGNFQISGNFTQDQATFLQNVLKYGALPLKFQNINTQSISPQLARTSLDAGLIAAAIGLALVVFYSFFYYRGLGIVSVLSLGTAALMAFLAVVILSKYQNFAMELSGIAGLIVAIGITADSFVVFFERLRDEVRDGKALRPAVESGWKRARRTVLVSDTVSFLAALVLYELAIGEVRGFAYTLGLTTIIDVVVVFLFTKPMVTLLARTKFFGSGHRWSGLDPVRLGARTPWRSSPTRNVRPARTAARSSATTRTSPNNPGEA